MPYGWWRKLVLFFWLSIKSINKYIIWLLLLFVLCRRNGEGGFCPWGFCPRWLLSGGLMSVPPFYGVNNGRAWEFGPHFPSWCTLIPVGAPATATTSRRRGWTVIDRGSRGAVGVATGRTGEFLRGCWEADTYAWKCGQSSTRGMWIGSGS